VNRTPRGRRSLAGLLVLGSLSLYGCYTVLSHPQLAPRQQITEDGTVVETNQCASCHTQSDLWSFHHRGWYSQYNSYFYNQYDPLFFRSRWYGDSYFYGRWVSYRYSPWWYYPGSRTGAWHPELPAVGRGQVRDSVNSVDPRDSFVGLPGYGPGPMPSFQRSALPLNTGMAGSPATSRVTRDSTSADRGSATEGRPVRVEPRNDAPAPLPVSQQPVQQPAATKSAEKAQESEDQEQAGEQPRGRGDARNRPSGSQSR